MSLYPHDDSIIDAEKREMELEIASLNKRLDALELQLKGALFSIDADYREMKGLERDIDELYVRVF